MENKSEKKPDYKTRMIKVRDRVRKRKRKRKEEDELGIRDPEAPPKVNNKNNN